MAPSVMTRASASVICAGTAGAGRGVLGVWVKPGAADANTRVRLPITMDCQDESPVFITSSPELFIGALLAVLIDGFRFDDERYQFSGWLGSEPRGADNHWPYGPAGRDLEEIAQP